MRILGLVILYLAAVACDPTPSKAGRYQQINNPRPASAFCPEPGAGSIFDPDCGLTILDTWTGTIFVRQQGQWHEENPQTGHFEEHPLK
jgi:hypothetical protein